MLNFLKTFKQFDKTRYSAQIRNTTVIFTLVNAISMDDNHFHIHNEHIRATFYNVDWKTVEAVINITDPITEES